MDTNDIFKKADRSIDLGSPPGAHVNFADRQRNLFEQLNEAERSVKGDSQVDITTVAHMEVDLDVNIGGMKRKRSETKSLRGKESIFKRPEAPVPKSLSLKSMPDFKKNPHKWTKYSLDDVRNEDMSEQSNTAAAMSFLQELEKRKDMGSNTQTESAGPTRIMFTSRNDLKYDVPVPVGKKVENVEKPSFVGSKFIMPEYIVGQKKKTKKNDHNQRIRQSKKELRLDHLLEEDS